jgi:hypothetical protein
MKMKKILFAARNLPNIRRGETSWKRRPTNPTGVRPDYWRKSKFVGSDRTSGTDCTFFFGCSVSCALIFHKLGLFLCRLDWQWAGLQEETHCTGSIIQLSILLNCFYPAIIEILTLIIFTSPLLDP